MRILSVLLFRIVCTVWNSLLIHQQVCVEVVLTLTWQAATGRATT